MDQILFVVAYFIFMQLQVLIRTKYISYLKTYFRHQKRPRCVPLTLVKVKTSNEQEKAN